MKPTDYGTRRCLICDDDFPTLAFGRHVAAHSDAELEQWPGGPLAVFDALRESIRESLRRTDDPRMRAQLTEGLAVVASLRREAIRRQS